MAKTYKIHPAIGIARVGNSPDEFFIGPERLGEFPEPAGGFKDAQCRVKRQAARFRIFEHHDDGTFKEITDADAEITWTVHLVNQKAAAPGRGNVGSAADLTIDPGLRSISAPNQHQLFDTGQIKFDGAPATTVPLGEIRSDPDNHLLVLGGHGISSSPKGTPLSGFFWSTPDWYDDTSDGPVTATIKLRADNSTPAVVGAWVIVAPPKFAPHQHSVITLYDRLFQAMVEGGLLTEPTTTSYTQDIYPILQRTRDTQWVIDLSAAPGAMQWLDPVMADGTRNTIFSALRAPDGSGDDMPLIFDSGSGDNRLTPTQYHHMQRWKDNGVNYSNDWVGPPAVQATVTPDGMDRAALEACVGGAFYPGIEAGGRPSDVRHIIAPGNYVEPFRLKASTPPGIITSVMALPWQNDFDQCTSGGSGTYWWPVPRPDYVTRGGVKFKSWTDGIVNGPQDMVDKWHQLGFVVRQGVQHVEVARCDTPSINLLTPVLNFQDVPQGPMAAVREIALAIRFEVVSPSSAVTLKYAPGGAPSHPQLVPNNTSVTVGPTPTNTSVAARLWVIYRTANVGDVLPAQTLTVQDGSGTQSWIITVVGNTVGRKTAAAALVLDRSGSMTEDRGDGQSKHDSLQKAAGIFVQAMLEGDGVGVVRFNQDAQVLQDVKQLGDGGLSDTNRGDTLDIINGNGLDPDGYTSIGDGIFEGRGILTSTMTPYDVKALVVLTDGVENRSRWIADVAADINEYTYAVGLGQPQNISVPALQTISGNNGGYLLITGAIGTDNRFLLSKYFLQILAGVSNAEIVLDPDGELIPGATQRIPFQLCEGDSAVDVIVLSPYINAIDFRLQTPSGLILEPWRALSEPAMRYVFGDGISYYRLALPTQLLTNDYDQQGTWHVLLSIGRPKLKPTEGTFDGAGTDLLRNAGGAVVGALRQRPARRATERERAYAIAQAAANSFTAAVPSDSTNAASNAPRHTLPYSVIVHSYSNVSLRANLAQTGYEPGARINVEATLAQSGIPMAKDSANVWAELTHPGGALTTLAFQFYDEGSWRAHFDTAAAGVYRLRIRARGETRSGVAFTRERFLTAAVWYGGDRDANHDPSIDKLIDILRECCHCKEGAPTHSDVVR